MLTLRSSFNGAIQNLLKTPQDLDDFGNLAVFRHADYSFEWKPCRIVRRTLKREFDSPRFAKSHNLSHYDYEIEFLHMGHQG